jgi:hypothetical protein
MVYKELCQLLMRDKDMFVHRVRIWCVLEAHKEVGEIRSRGLGRIGDRNCPVASVMGMTSGKSKLGMISASIGLGVIINMSSRNRNTP